MPGPFKNWTRWGRDFPAPGARRKETRGETVNASATQRPE